MSRSYRPSDLHAAGQANPLRLAAQGFFWSGGELVDHPQAGKAMRGQQYVEYWIPQDLVHPLPIVMIHGGGGEGTHHAVEKDADGGRQRNGGPAPAEGQLQGIQQHAGCGAQPGRKQQAEENDADHHEGVALTQAGWEGACGTVGGRHGM